MLIRLLVLFCFLTFDSVKLFTQNSWNVDLFGQVNRGDTRYSGSWSYIAPDGSEFALIGAKTGTSVYPIDDPGNIIELGFVPGPETNWREITTIGHFAFVVTDVQGTGHGMQVIDLSYLPDSLHLVTTYMETFTTGHIIQKAIGSDEPYVYVMGTSTSQGVHILDVSDPANPVEIGVYAPGYYIHDAHIRGNLMYAAAFYETDMDIVDISDKTNPVLIGKISYEGNNTHSSSTTEDGKYLFIADENDGYPARMFNVEDPDNPVEVAQYTANEASLVHNPYILGDYCYISHNTEGLRVLDIVDPELPVEVGFFDTWTGPSGGFNGLWSACPYFPSGKIIGGNRTDGLYVWTFNQTKAARIYGIVNDSLSGLPLFNAEVEIPELAASLTTNFDGNFKKGMLEGSYTLLVSAAGYLPKTLEVNLLQGDSIWLEIPLTPENATAVLENYADLEKITVYPNPASSMTTVDLTKIENAASLVIYTESGAAQRQFSVEGCEIFPLEIRDLNNGTYRLVVLNQQKSPVATATIVVFD